MKVKAFKSEAEEFGFEALSFETMSEVKGGRRRRKPRTRDRDVFDLDDEEEKED